MLEKLLQIIIGNGGLAFSALVFVSASTAALAISRISGNWSDVRRRAVAGRAQGAFGEPLGEDLLSRDLAAKGFLAGVLPTSEAEKSNLRQFLNLAGFYGPNSPAIFQLSRFAAAIVLGLSSALVYGRFLPRLPLIATIALSIGVGLLGYILPRTFVSLRRDALCDEHRHGFPDFLDLLVICVEAGIGIESAMQRVGKDLARSYPSLARNLGFMVLELRAGKTTREALDNLAIRLGIPEARSFAAVIQQSEELGSSLVQALRVYADDMRDKRLSRAEEKASALPVKMVFPLAFFIFPVILGITLMPVAIRLFQALKL